MKGVDQLGSFYTFRAQFYARGAEIRELEIKIAAKTREEAMAVAALHSYRYDGAPPFGGKLKLHMSTSCDSITLTEMLV